MVRRHTTRSYFLNKGSKPSNYRPISLTCIASKLMEHIIVSIMMDYFDTHNTRLGRRPKSIFSLHQRPTRKCQESCASVCRWHDSLPHNKITRICTQSSGRLTQSRTWGKRMVNGIQPWQVWSSKNTQEKETSYLPIHTSWHHPQNHRKLKISRGRYQ